MDTNMNSDLGVELPKAVQEQIDKWKETMNQLQALKEERARKVDELNKLLGSIEKHLSYFD